MPSGEEAIEAAGVRARQGSADHARRAAGPSRRSSGDATDGRSQSDVARLVHSSRKGAGDQGSRWTCQRQPNRLFAPWNGVVARLSPRRLAATHMTRFDPVAATPVRVRAMSPEKISVLLDEERLVEGIIRSPAMPHHDLAESIVQRQRTAELTDDLALHSAEEIGAVLATLPVDEARALWCLVPEARQNEILWELPDGLRDLLADSREP